MKYNFRVQDIRDLRVANSQMQGKDSNSVMCVYIYNTPNDGVKKYLEKYAAEIASNNGHSLTLLTEDPGDIAIG
ncbi:hypothetical protein TSUD_346820 [Trifolium subterraneum]|nr:hypothetical protein TSUD_346820 [Trifolium subterraneum]